MGKLVIKSKGDIRPIPKPKPRIVKSQPNPEVEQLKAQLANVAQEQAAIRKEKLVMALERAKIKSDYHDFALASLGALDPNKKEDLGKIDEFAKRHSAMVDTPAPKEGSEKKSPWSGTAKAKPGTLAASMPASVLEAVMSGAIVKGGGE